MWDFLNGWLKKNNDRVIQDLIGLLADIHKFWNFAYTRKFGNLPWTNTSFSYHNIILAFFEGREEE
jgi:hypothetical protein